MYLCRLCAYCLWFSNLLEFVGGLFLISFSFCSASSNYLHNKDYRIFNGQVDCSWVSDGHIFEINENICTSDAMEMPKKMGVALPTHLMAGQVLKVIYTVTITCDGTANKDIITTLPLLVNNLVEIRFKWVYSNKIVKNFKIDCSFSSRYRSSDLQKNTTVEMDVVSNSLCYSKMGICPNEYWLEWKHMAKMSAQLITGTTNMYYATCDFFVTAQKVKTDTISSKLYADTTFTDFRLSTSEGSIEVHKACMAAHSDVFKTMLSGEWRETAEGKITMQGVTLETLQHLKDYMYLGTVPNEGLRPLLLIARCYLLGDLESQCITKLAQTVTSDDLYSLHKFACENNIPELTFATLQMTRDSVVSCASLLKKYKPSS